MDGSCFAMRITARREPRPRADLARPHLRNRGKRLILRVGGLWCAVRRKGGVERYAALRCL
eukprot:5595638-Prymnesium_polylepis.1